MAGEAIRTTHAGSLPRPDDVVDMIWGQLEGNEVDPRRWTSGSMPPWPMS